METAHKAAPKRSVNAPSKKKRRAVTVLASSALPPPPAEMSASASREWKRIGPRAVALGMVADLDAVVFGLYCTSVGDAMDVRQSWVLEGSPLTVERPSGPRPHPALQLLRELGADAARYANMLGLSPRARRGLAISLGAVPAMPVGDPDDAASLDADLGRRFFND